MGKSGKEIGRENFLSFECFIKKRKDLCDWGIFIAAGGRRLKKQAICKECGFGRSAFVQNPEIKALYSRLESELIAKGILKSGDDNISPITVSGLARDEIVALLEVKIAELETEIANINRMINAVNKKVSEYETEAGIIINSRNLKTLRKTNE